MPLETAPPVDLTRLRHACERCGLKPNALPPGMSNSAILAFDQALRTLPMLERGDVLFRNGDPCRGLYIVRAGSLKTEALSEAGVAQILGFHLPGQLLGVAGMSQYQYTCDAVALERSAVCELPFAQLEMLLGGYPAVRQHILQLLGDAAQRHHRHLLLMGRRQAQERLAQFIRDIAEQQRTPFGAPFRLSMSRHDLANYLGLAIETVSRLFSKMRAQGVLEVHGKRITIRDRAALLALCGEVAPSPRRAIVAPARIEPARSAAYH